MDLDLPGGVITTHCVSTVVRPGSKQTHDPLQFVKIQSNELSKKAVEQIRLAEEVKITKEKIKEVEEEWQNNLLNWKSKRRKSRSSGVEEDDTQENSHRKIKTFSEILNEKAKSGYRIGYNLHKYVGLGDDEGENDGDDEIGNKNEGTKESSNRVDFLASSYEEQQAQLQKKREELSNKLQELQELENKQRELERQEKGGISERVNATEYSNDEPISQKNTLDSEELVITSNIHQKIDRENICDWNQASLNQGMRQSPEVAVDDNHNQEQFQISHQEILKTNDKNEETASTQPLGSFSRSDESESENDHPDEHTEVDEEAERKQMLSFKAKLSTFENLSKTKIDDELSKPKTSPSKTRFHKSTSDAQIDITNKSERPIFKSRPPAVEDLARSEGLRVAQQRRQIPENNGVSADIDQTNYRRLERENYQTSVPPLGASYLKSYPSTPGSRGNDSSKIHSSTFPGSEDNRGSWDQHNYVCDKEVEIISERMNRLPGSSNASTMPDISTIQSYETVPKFVPQTCDIGLPPLNSVHLSFSGQSVPNEATFSNVHQQNLGSEEFQQLRPRCRQPISNQHTHLQNTNELYANHNQFVAQKQMPSLPTHLLNASQRDGLNPQFIYSNQFFDPRISQVSVPIKTQEPVLTSPIYQAPHGYESLRQRPYYYPLGDVSSVFPKSFENPHGTRNPDEGLQSSSAPQRINLPDRHSQQIGKNQLASNMSPQRISYNHNHWVIQEAELRRLHSKGSNMGQIKNTINSTNDPKSSSFENHVYENTSIQNSYNCAHQAQDMRGIEKANSTLEGSEQRQNQILSVSGKKKCSNCGDELGRGCAAMVIETLSLYYHINCFRCFVCHTQLGNGSCGTDVRVRNQKLHCHNCYSNDEAGLKFSRV